MSFHWFRKNKTATRWIYIILTLFTMLTFSVTGAVTDFFKGGPSKSIVGTFKTPSGKTVEIDSDDFRFTAQTLSRATYQTHQDEDVWKFIIMDALAGEAGIQVSDEMLSSMFTNVIGIRDAASYKEMVKRSDLSVADFESMWRRIARTVIYERLNTWPERSRASETFQRFQDEAESFTIDAVAWADADYATKVDRAAITDADLQKFLDTDLDRARLTKEFSAPAEVKLDAAALAVDASDAAKLEKLRASLPAERRTIQDFEINSTYENEKERWKLPAEEPVPPPAPAPENPPANPPPAPTPKYKPLEEVKATIETEILANRVVDEAATQYRKALAGREQKKRAEAAKAAADPVKPPAPAEVPADPADTEDLLAKFATQFGLELIPAGEFVKIGDVATLPRFGSDSLKTQIEPLAKDQALAIHADKDHAAAFLVRVTDKIDPKPLPLAEVKDRLIDPYVEFVAAKQSSDAAKAFIESLRTAARAKYATEVAAVEDPAKKRATDAAAKESITDPAEVQKKVDAELALMKGQVDTVLAPHLGEFFDEAAKQQALPVTTVGPFRETYSRTQFYAHEPKGLEHYLKGAYPLFQLEKGAVTIEPQRDADDKLAVVARIKERTQPTFDEMTLGDRVEMEQYDAMMRNFQKQFAQRGGQDTGEMSYGRLSLLVNLQRTKPSEKG